MSRRLIAAAIAAVVGCTQARGASYVAVDSARADSTARVRQDSINRAQPGYVIDSVLPVDEELRRFREAIGGRAVTSLAHASPSRDALVRRAIAALSAGDTADIRAMTLSAREFADLVFETSPFSRPPYRQPVGLAWQQIHGSNTTGANRLVRRMHGGSWRYVDQACPSPSRAEHQGRNTIWASCDVRVVAPAGDTLTLRLFGSIIERDGSYKVVAFR